jgi:hypothetical protein
VEGRVIRLTKMEFEQEMHCCGPAQDDMGSLAFSVHDGGGGDYVVIDAHQWAIDPKDGESADKAIARLRKLLGAK